MKNKILVASACVALAVLGNSTGWAYSCATDGLLQYVCLGDGSGPVSWVAINLQESKETNGQTTVSSTADTCDGTSSVRLWNGWLGSPFGSASVTYTPAVASVAVLNTQAVDRGICFVRLSPTSDNSGNTGGTFVSAYDMPGLGYGTVSG